MIEQDFYTVDELAAAMRVSRQTVIKMIDDGKLKAPKIGRAFRISRQEVERFWLENWGVKLFTKGQADDQDKS